jgi:hypothetical protein
MDQWTAKDVEHILINPFYAITISDDLMGADEPSQDDVMLGRAHGPTK